jgi:hypothetical protein
MPSKSVALEADVVCTPGSTVPSGFASGSWALNPAVTPNPSVQKYTKLTINSQGVIYEAKGSFLFTGTLSIGGAGTTPEVVELLAGTTKLQKNENKCLVNGDTITGSVGGNIVKIVSTRKLKTA